MNGKSVQVDHDVLEYINSLVNAVCEAREEKAEAEQYRDLLMEVLTTQDQYNGHYQMIFETLSIHQLHDIMKLVEKEGLDGQSVCCSIRIHGDASGSLYADDFWGGGEHLLGHRDRMICGVNKITGLE